MCLDAHMKLALCKYSIIIIIIIITIIIIIIQNSKYVYCQYIEIQHVYNCQHCVSYTLQPNRYHMEWNGNGACRPAANPGTTAPGLPSWCRHRGPETTRPNRGSGARRWNFGQPNPRWTAVARPKVRMNDDFFSFRRPDHSKISYTYYSNAITTCAKPRNGLVVK